MELLVLESTGEQILSFATFGSNKEQAKVCKNRKRWYVLEGPISLCLYVVPTLCDPLVGQPVTACITNSSSFKG